MSEARMLVREARIEDAAALGELMEQVDEVHQQALPHIFQRPPWPIHDSATIGEIISSEDCGLFVAEDPARDLVGFVFLTIQESPVGPLWAPRRFAVIESIGVAMEHRRSGVASDMMRVAEAWAAARGADAMELSVYEFNRNALALYYQIGYTCVSRNMSKRL